MLATSPIKSVTPNLPGRIIVKMGMFPRIPRSEMENFADHRQDWQGKHNGLAQYRLVIYGDKVDDKSQDESKVMRESSI